MHKFIRDHLVLMVKGFAMGAANVIPGVSGGTIALITGIFEKLINAIKSIDHRAAGLLFRGKFNSLSGHISFSFLFAVFSGALLSVFTLARLLAYLFDHYPVYIWAYFFGLILASVWFVGKRVDKWKFPAIASFTAGALLAGMISFMNPAAGNENFLYLILCGMVAVCSMILPGLSGSFILILMGNYELVAINAINELRVDILIPFFIGIIAGLLAFSHFLSWILRRFRNITLASLTGFIAGSLVILWPWKNPVYKTDEFLLPVLMPDGNPVIQSYSRFIPGSFNEEVIVAILLMTAGCLTILAIERIAEVNPPQP